MHDWTEEQLGKGYIEESKSPLLRIPGLITCYGLDYLIRLVRTNCLLYHW
jgi:hypothetical protein